MTGEPQLTTPPAQRRAQSTFRLIGITIPVQNPSEQFRLPP